MTPEDINKIVKALRESLEKPLMDQLKYYVDNEIARRIHNLSEDAASNEIHTILRKAVKRYIRVSVEVNEA